MKHNLYLLPLFLLPFYLPAQNSNKRIEKSVYGFYGRHLPTKYFYEGGKNTLVTSKTNLNLGIGVNLDYAIDKRIGIRTGANLHLLFLCEDCFGVNGPAPTNINPVDLQRTRSSIEDVKSSTLNVPVKFSYKLINKKTLNFLFCSGPSLAIHSLHHREQAALYIYSNGVPVRAYLINRTYDKVKPNTDKMFAHPEIEWDFDLEVKKILKHYGAINVGIKTHLDSKHLESAILEFFPEYLTYYSTGHFRINRDYIGLYAGFTFGKN